MADVPPESTRGFHTPPQDKPLASLHSHPVRVHQQPLQLAPHLVSLLSLSLRELVPRAFAASRMAFDLVSLGGQREQAAAMKNSGGAFASLLVVSALASRATIDLRARDIKPISNACRGFVDDARQQLGALPRTFHFQRADARLNWARFPRRRMRDEGSCLASMYLRLNRHSIRCPAMTVGSLRYVLSDQLAE